MAVAQTWPPKSLGGQVGLPREVAQARVQPALWVHQAGLLAGYDGDGQPHDLVVDGASGEACEPCA